MTTEELISKVKAEMQAAGVSINEDYLKQLVDMEMKQRGMDNPAATQTGSVQSQISNILSNLPEGSLPEGQGSGEAPGGTKGTDVSGPMDQATRNAMGAIGALTSGPLGVSPFGMLGWASDLAGYFGVSQETDPAYGLQNVQDVTDTFGAYAGASAAAKNQAAIDAFNTVVGLDESGYSDYSSGKTTPGGFAGPGNPGTPSVGNPDMNTKDPGWGSNETGPDTSGRSSQSGYAGGVDPGGGPSGSPDSNDKGNDGSGQGGQNDARKGGVFHAAGKKAVKTKWGEPGTGGETAVFVPKNIQSPEKDQVIMALEQLLMELKGRQDAGI